MATVRNYLIWTGKSMGVFFLLMIPVLGMTMVLSLASGRSSGDGPREEEKKEVVAAVERFWRLSVRGEREASASLISMPSEEFWERCQSDPMARPEEPPLNGRSVSVIGSDDNRLPNSGYYTRPLDFFWKQIMENKPELIETEIIRINNIEAVARIRWRGSGQEFYGYNDRILLRKEDGEWKLMLLRAVEFPHPAIEAYATTDGC